MSTVVPTIMAETIDDYKAAVERITPFARRVHIDISDGQFAPTFLLGEAQLWWPQGWEVDIHAMVSQPAAHLDQLIVLKPSMVILHAESEGDLLESVAKLKAAGIKTGLALLKPTVPAAVESIIKEVDHVMIFSGDLGNFGGTASMMQLEKVRLVKALNPKVEIGWDGGVSVDNAYTLTQGGVDVLNVGGAIALAENPADAYQAIVAETNKHGVI